MIDVLDAASYLANEYEKKHNRKITEMKLHKLLYFAQREALVRTSSPIFSAQFQGWRFGPVIPEVRYSFYSLLESDPHLDNQDIKDILDFILSKYGEKDAWSLSRLTHGEYSWIHSRQGIGEYENSNRTISLDDIRIDADRIKERRSVLGMLEEC